MKKRRTKRAAALACLLCLLLPMPGRAAAEDGECFPACGRDCPSLVDALNGLGADSSFEARGEIAKANGYRDYRGTAGQNTALLYLLRLGRLRRPKADAGPLTANLDRVRFLHQEPKTCKATAAAMALNLLTGSDSCTTADLGGSWCRSIDGDTFTGSDGHAYRAVYKTDGYEGSLEELTKAVGDALDAGLPIVSAVHSVKGGTQHHWVLVLGRRGEDWLIADPARSGSGSIGGNAVTMASRGYAFGLADCDTLHYGYITFHHK